MVRYYGNNYVTKYSGHPGRIAWIAIDMQETFQITSFSIKFEVAFANQFAMEVSQDGFEHWTRIGIWNGIPDWVHYNLTEEQQRLARGRYPYTYYRLFERYVKCQLLEGRYWDWGMSIWHFRVFGW